MFRTTADLLMHPTSKHPRKAFTARNEKYAGKAPEILSSQNNDNKFSQKKGKQINNQSVNKKKKHLSTNLPDLMFKCTLSIAK